MVFVEMLAIALAMSVDAFCVSLCIGMKYHKPAHYIRLGLAFGFFQFVMPLIGAGAGSVALDYSTHVKYIAIGILLYVTVLMLKSAVKAESCELYSNDPTRGWQLVMLSLATSMDALGIGVAVPVMELHILYTAVVIGIVCFFASMVGVFAGKFSSEHIGHRAEYVGAVVLLIIAVKIAITV